MSPDKAAFLAATDVSRETLERLEIYADLLKKWNPRINLVSASTLDAIWTRHFLDSAQLMDLGGDIAHWCDLGTGGGFPGLVVAVLGPEKAPATRFTLVEADQRKAQFLRTVLREAGVTANVIAERIESQAPKSADIVSARALAPLPKLLALADGYLAPGGTGLFPKGARAADEVSKALELWRFRCETVQSKTDEDAVILKISELSRA